MPWRQTKDAYRILVSEVMLQQTQVSRVKGKYREFLKAFPTVRVLARAPLADVLKVWSGLGYNRRAKYLRDAAIAIVEKHNGRVPAIYSELVELPGVGDYTARAIRVFAFNEPDTLIETNIRSVFLHHFYSSVLQKTAITNAEIFRFAQYISKGQNPRKWHWALMDYGAHLKASGVRVNARSAHYAKQSKFNGSLRQVRGTILKTLSHGSPINDLRSRYGRRLEKALASLVRDGLIIKGKGKWRIS